jgi:RimJ/RimL family protein N-acetyltransferase
VTRTILADGVVAGHALSFERDGRRLVGYWLAREHWGRGIATRALAAFLEVLPQRPLHATVAEHNAASLRVLAKAGFEVCGRDAGGLALCLR